MGRHFFSVFFFVILLSGNLFAGEQETRSITFVQALSREAIEEAKTRDALEEQNTKVPTDVGKREAESDFRDLFNQYFNGNYIGRFILGKYWRTATPQQRTEYSKLFNCLVITSYEKRFADYKGEALIVKSAHHSGKLDVIVSTEMTQPNIENVRIDWRVRMRNNTLKIIDVVVEDISLSLTQRSEYAALLQKNANDMNVLLAKMREKVCECHCEDLF